MPENNTWEAMKGEELLQALEQYSVSEGISDIHTSPEKEFVRLEVRLHGMLELLGKIAHKDYEDYVRRVKFKSKLKLNLTNVPQDGQYTFDAPGRQVNVRVASIPSRFGETFTLRLLDPEKGIIPLEQLGFPPELHQQMLDIANMPNGLFLVTGPTGSGKTTTLYALLSTQVGKSRNIITLEDPIEYELPGIVQSQVDHTHDYTFASGLRSILRHDPDVILVGEIRDLETAQTAIDAALTGHIVLSTLHTNSAVEAIPRLLSMGVSPYTFAPSLRGVLAQRLVRTLKDEYRTKGAKYDPAAKETYGGRIAIPELLVVDDKIRNLILMNEASDTILTTAKQGGYKTMQEWGKMVVDASLTSRAEVERVTI
ncbi:MAG: GspE/PulE family protein [Candidatus Peribacteraceae bacterium]|nr:GspE/PulE family protein [Candidatus Peribacteraceae bacterium]